MQHELPKLQYDYDGLEPYLDARTMEIHHAGHHAAYVAKLNEALRDHPELQERPIENLLRSLDSIPEAIRTAVRNYGGGHHNHSAFWRVMAPAGKGGGGEPYGKLGEAIRRDFGSFSNFREAFTAAAATLFGSGWAWLIADGRGGLHVAATQNQDTPITDGLHPILTLDVWEHAYYLKYQNRRPEFIEAWWSVVNWNEAERNFADATR